MLRQPAPISYTSHCDLHDARWRFGICGALAAARSPYRHEQRTAVWLVNSRYFRGYASNDDTATLKMSLPSESSPALDRTEPSVKDQPARWRSLVQDASASLPSHTPADGAAGLANGGSCHARTVHHCPARAAADGNLRNHAVRLRNRRGRHSVRKCCDGQGQASSCNQPDHLNLPSVRAIHSVAVGGLLLRDVLIFVRRLRLVRDAMRHKSSL
jgi:hypothetical protein